MLVYLWSSTLVIAVDSFKTVYRANYQIKIRKGG